MEGRFLAKSNKDETITKNGEENVDCWKWNGLLFQLTYPNRGALPAFKKNSSVNHFLLYSLFPSLLFPLFCKLSLSW